ncbi:MAG: D-alanyl-D-alanine carboxypeptidase family protein [Oscillospiraceae bacterium]
MKKLRQMFLFTMLCCFIITLMNSPVTASAEGCSAKAAVVYDRASGEILYQSNAFERLPMASTTKIMSALIALESGGLDEEFVVDSEAIKVEGSSMGLKEGDRVTMRSLVCGMLLPSGNDAANAAAVRVAGSVDKFVEMMNERAKQLGLKDTHFVTPSGLDDDTDEHYSTAYDMAVLADKALENEDFAEICSQKYIKLRFGDPPYDRWLTNSNKLLGSCEGVFGVKTGFTDKAKRCLVSACRRNGAELICVTLNDPDDWQDHSALYDMAFEKMESITLPCEKYSFEVNTAGGICESVNAKTERVKMTLPKGAGEHITSVVCIKPFVFAPVKSGETVGTVSYYYNDRLLCQKPITAQEDVLCQPTESGGWEGLLCEIRKAVENKLQ